MNEELDDEFILQLKNDFLTEAYDLLYRFDCLLIQVNNNQQLTLDEIRDIFKIIHTLKGNCRAAGFDQLGTFFHKFENLLAPLRDGTMTANKNTYSLFFKVLEKSQESIEIYKKNLDAIIDFSSIEELIENINTPQLEKYKIAVIDDDASIREIICCALSSEFPAEIIEFSDGHKALEEMTKNKYDFIIVDYQMPIMDGKEFLKGIRLTSTTNSKTPVLFISGQSPDIENNTTMIDDIFYLHKPFDISRIIYYAKCSFIKHIKN